jgi:hypothetical protein
MIIEIDRGRMHVGVTLPTTQLRPRQEVVGPERLTILSEAIDANAIGTTETQGRGFESRRPRREMRRSSGAERE